jgi:membrane associated rhomboid family serine protease
MSVPAHKLGCQPTPPPPPPPPPRQPIFNVPPMTKALIAANVAVHIVLSALPPRIEEAALLAFAFFPVRYTVPDLFGWEAIVSPLTYQFMHGNWTHLGVNMLGLLAFGAGVERWIGRWRMLVLSLLCGVISAAAHFAVYPHSVEPVVGASGAISGLFGAILRAGFDRRTPGAMRRLLLLVGLWLVINVVTAKTGMPGAAPGQIAWVAHVGGFLAGLILFPAFRMRWPGRGQGAHTKL